ncbi:MAG TPA: STAS domain-containing protein [Methylotenera sp.]|nr:STAS domain-containing protein [Methylotenera sp.]
MNITQQKLETDIDKIDLSGRMDLDGVGQIEKEFARMTAAPATAVIVDMTEVPYMSSIGIRALLMNGKSVTGRGGKYVLMGTQPDVRNVLAVSGIDKLITICDSLDQAITAVR